MEVSLEKRTKPYLSVSVWMRVIDPFGQMKREYNTILDVAYSANRINLVQTQSFTWRSPGNVSQGDQQRNINGKTATKPALGAQLFQITVTCVKLAILGKDGKNTL